MYYVKCIEFGSTESIELKILKNERGESSEEVSAVSFLNQLIRQIQLKYVDQKQPPFYPPIVVGK